MTSWSMVCWLKCMQRTMLKYSTRMLWRNIRRCTRKISTTSNNKRHCLISAFVLTILWMHFDETTYRSTRGHPQGSDHLQQMPWDERYKGTQNPKSQSGNRGDRTY